MQTHSLTLLVWQPNQNNINYQNETFPGFNKTKLSHVDLADSERVPCKGPKKSVMPECDK